jgi:predicted SnoaL-like aldol condensation-catalyzing enzyme
MKIKQNKDAAVSFLRKVVAGDIREAYAQHVHPQFQSHNPHFGASAAELMAAMEEDHRTHPKKVLDVQRTIEEGDLVAVHSRIRMQPAHRGIAAVHLFRFEGGRIVEFWDVAQEVPDTAVNAAGMF